MSEERFTSVWDAIEETPEQSEEMRMRSSLLIALQEEMARSGKTQKAIAQRFGITQPRVSDLKRGKIDLFGLPSLLTIAKTAGLQVEMSITGRTPLSEAPVRTTGAVKAKRVPKAATVKTKTYTAKTADGAKAAPRAKVAPATRIDVA